VQLDPHAQRDRGGITESEAKARLHMIFQQTSVESRTRLALRVTQSIGD
jgi:hypothetical protein